MTVMDANDTPASAADRRRPALLASLTLAGSALLLAACSTLEPTGEHPAYPEPSLLRSPPGNGQASSGPPGKPVSSRERRASARVGSEVTLLPDQVDDGSGADAEAGRAPHRAAAAGERSRRPARAAAKAAAPRVTSVAGPVSTPVSSRAAARDSAGTTTTAAAAAVTAASATATARAAEKRAAHESIERPRGAAAALAHTAGAGDIAADYEAALAQTEPLHPTANRPYTVANRRYHPMKSRKAYRQRGMASWYGRQFHGRKTATGERFDMHEMTAAHPTLPLPSWVRVTHSQTGESVVVRVNDRGPFAGNRIIDLSHAAAKQLGFVDDGLVAVEVELLLSGDNPETESAD